MRQDHVSGASEILWIAADQLLHLLPTTSTSPRWLAPVLRQLIAEQPAMGAVHRLASRALEVARTAEKSGLDEAASRREVAASVRSFAADFAAASDRLVECAAEDILPEEGFVATLSHSTLVERAFLEGHRRGKSCGALIAESRPLYEGRTLAGRLAEAGIPVLFATDAAAAGLLGGTVAVLVGADAVLPKSFLNKAGTTALLLGARELGMPSHALAQTAKFLPAEASLIDLVQRDAAQVWAEPAAGVRVLNPTFEEVDLRLVQGLVTERGVLPPGEVGLVAKDSQMSPEFCRMGQDGGRS